MQNIKIIKMHFFLMVGFLALLPGAKILRAQSPLKAKCARLAEAITGHNYHRSGANEIDSGQIWRFLPRGKLLLFAAGKTGFAENKPLSEARWNLGDEDEGCVLKVAGVAKAEITYRLIDVTWAIVKIGGEDKNIPDFEDHAGMKTRYCGTGSRCERLWR